MNLTDPVTKIPTVGNVYASKLKKLDILSIQDLINHIPTRYKDYRVVKKISALKEGETVTIFGSVKSVKNEYTRGRFIIQKAKVEDETGECDAIWFNQRFIPQVIPKGSQISLSAVVEKQGDKLVLNSPDYELAKNATFIHTARLVPVYRETQGVSSKWLRSKIFTALTLSSSYIQEFLADDILAEHKLRPLLESYNKIHFPNTLEEVKHAKKRLAFNEFFYLHLKSLIRKNQWQKTTPAFKLNVNKNEVDKFIQELPFTLTVSQSRSVTEITTDMQKDYPMNRLLEGDVGSGKTVVATIAALIAFLNEKQSILMAPTQILAQQHYETLAGLFNKYKIRLSLLTSTTKKMSLGKPDIIIGTHALIHKKVLFDNVALVIIDEQHKFGVEQRAHLVNKSKVKPSESESKSQRSLIAPHILTMTATPIPRTVALTAYGDLDLSTLAELPSGRKKTKTWVVPENRRPAAHKWIKQLVKNERAQAFIICPLIDESVIESMQQVKAATAEFATLKKVFAGLKLGLLHGRLSASEKQDVITRFRLGELDILVSTPVVEVGVDIPNATLMVIETAHRFGLASLHQLRGRVGRGEKQSYCLLFTQNRGGVSARRLAAMEKSLSGFELAEIDLTMRGPGELVGIKQHGFSDLKIANWADKNLIVESLQVAQKVQHKPMLFKKTLKLLHLANIAMN